jgi:DNA-binding LacI/PurR family transcriptional regulator
MTLPVNKPVRLSDVARAAGVSKATASNVFSWPERVRPELRERVATAALSLGYAGPDPKGRLLSSGKANAIGVVTPGTFGISNGFRHPYMRDFLAGVADVCEERGAGLSLVSGIDDQKAWGIRNALVDGFILSRIEEIELIEPAVRRRLPFVVMDVDAGPDVN